MSDGGTRSPPRSAGSIRSGTRPVEMSIILATLNERSNLPELVMRIQRQAPASTEVIVVDDGSADGTREYVEGLSASPLEFRLLKNPGKQTTLRAQCQGIDAARGSKIVVMDADLQHPPELIPQLMGALDEGAYLAIASRYVPGGSAGQRTTFRWLMSRGAEALTRILLPAARGIRDPVSGYFAFRRDVWVALNPLYRGYKLLLFLLVMCEGRPVREVPFRFTPRAEGSSKVTGSYAFLRVFAIELLMAGRLRRQIRTAGRRLGDAASSPNPHSLPR
jgi:dolichol-phosphate mannosyltransferase